MREELLKMVRDYLNRVTVEELKRDLAECWVDGENIIKNKDSYNHNHIEYSIEEPHYFKDRNLEWLWKDSRCYCMIHSIEEPLYLKGENSESLRKDSYNHNRVFNKRATLSQRRKFRKFKKGLLQSYRVFNKRATLSQRRKFRKFKEIYFNGNSPEY